MSEWVSERVNFLSGAKKYSCDICQSIPPSGPPGRSMALLPRERIGKDASRCFLEADPTSFLDVMTQLLVLEDCVTASLPTPTENPSQ